MQVIIFLLPAINNKVLLEKIYYNINFFILYSSKIDKITLIF